MTTTDDPIAAIVKLFADKGDSEYGGEAVNQREHAYQTAACALRDGAGTALVVAALLHDIGHMLHDLQNDAPNAGIDDAHEAVAAHVLSAWFGSDVTEPIRLHVDAKRYLAATQPAYLRILSPPSLTSLRLQGGPMNSADQQDFRQHDSWEAAVRLRQWDDQAKVRGAATPTIEDFIPLIRTVMRPHRDGTGNHTAR